MKVPDKTSVLMFHGIGEAGHAFEPGEEEYWISWDQFDEINDHCAASEPHKFAFTFDDGNSSDVVAARKMRDKGVPGSFFVLVGRIDTPGYLTSDEVRELGSLGMEVGLHGRDHVDWRKTDEASLRSEVDLAREELSDLCGTAIDTVAIPYGAYDRRVWNYLDASSFTRIYTSDRGLARESDRFVRRNPIMSWHRANDIEATYEDKVGPVARLRRTVMPMVKRRI